MPSWTGTTQNDVITPGQISRGIFGEGLPDGGADTLDGGGGADTLDGGGGGDLVLGGAGDDLITVTQVAGAGPHGAIDGAGGPADGGGGGGDPVPAGPDSLFGGAGNDIIQIATPASGSETAIVDGGAGQDTLSLTGGGAAGGTFSLQAAAGGHMALSLTQGGAQVSLDTVNVETVNVAASTLSSASVSGLAAGANSLILLQSGSNVIVEGSTIPVVTLANLAAGASLTVATGSGDDYIDATRMGLSGHIQTLDAGAGNDTLLVNNSIALGGAGNDTFVWLRDDGADTMDGGAGFDIETVSTGGSADTIVLGANAAGHVIESLNGVIQDLVRIERIDIAAGDRADTITLGDLSHTDVRTVNIDLSGSAGGPDGAADVVNLAAAPAGEQVSFVRTADGHGLQALYTLNGAVQQTVSVTGIEAIDRVAIAGGAGDDTFTLSALEGNAHLSIDGGAGQNIDNQAGTSGDDVFSVSADQAGLPTETVNGEIVDLINVQTLNIAALEGFDAIRIGDLTMSTLKTVNVDLAGASGVADGQIDTVDIHLNSWPGATVEFRANSDPDGSLVFTTATATGGVLQTTRVAHLDSSDRVTLNLGSDDDRFVGGENTSPGTFIVNAGDGNDGLTGTNMVLNGEGGNDTIDIHGGLASGGDGADTLRGSLVAETLKGDAGDDSLAGNGGSDFIEGGDGRDTIIDEDAFRATLIGGAGDDKIVANADQVTMLGGDGNDDMTFDGATLFANLSGGAGNDIISSTGSIQTIEGDDGNDSITVWGHGSTVHGGAGDDSIVINPLIHMLSTAPSVVFGDAGDDVVSWFEDKGERNALFFDGGTGNDELDSFYGSARGLTQVLSSNGQDGLITSGFTAFNGDPATVHSVETVKLSMGTGADHVVIEDLTGSGIRFVDIDLGNYLHAREPDGAADAIDLSASAGADTIVAQELGGGDLEFDGMPAAVVLENLDAIQGGSRVQDTIWLNGGAGDDLIDLRRLPTNHGIYVEGGFGNDTISAGAGGATFNFDDGLRGFDVIDHYQIGLDRIDVKGLADQSVTDMIAHHHLVQDGADVDILDGRGALLKLTGINIHNLTSADFLFHAPGV